MERYVTQLIEDLQAAQTLKVSAIYTARGDEMTKGSFEKFFGIESIAFPPAEKLSESQQIALSNAITELLDAHRYMLNITMIKDLPASVLYQYLVKMWTESLYYVTDGLAGLEFCEDDPEKCSLREWCKGTWCEVPDDYVPVFYDGIYDDEGNKIDIEKIPIPALCLTCQSYLTDDWEENILCSMNRADKREEGEKFECGAYILQTDLEQGRFYP
ncbi:hypothetical protein AGMMS50239_27970 [Bacteroidia bacterium]|nr:hypothetical protein AGMMS50239_27970 [Bacteroidia bacterium]